MKPATSLISFLALCQADEPAEIRVATCQLLVPQDAHTPPEWVELLPSGERLEALDGRKFWNPTPSKIVELFNQHPVDLAVDYEHGSETRAKRGEEAPASGWIKELRLRKDGAIEGRIEWTSRGGKAVCDKEYRYISPAFHWNRETGEILSLSSAGLTTHPALVVKALSRAQDKQPTSTASTKKDPAMKLNAEHRKALGLKDDHTDDEASTALTAYMSAHDEMAEKYEKMGKAKASVESEVATLSASVKDVTKYVPRADYDVQCARVRELEGREVARVAAEFKSKAEAVIEGGVKAGKIAPASREHYLALCNDQAHLDAVEKMLSVAPSLVAPIGGFGGKAAGDKPELLSAQAKTLAAKCGISEEEMEKSAAMLKKQSGNIED